MGREIDLLEHYPRTKRDVVERGATKTEDVRRVAEFERPPNMDFWRETNQWAHGEIP
jgi:hypothetical protein